MSITHIANRERDHYLVVEVRRMGDDSLVGKSTCQCDINDLASTREDAKALAASAVFEARRKEASAASQAPLVDVHTSALLKGEIGGRQ